MSEELLHSVIASLAAPSLGDGSLAEGHAGLAVLFADLHVARPGHGHDVAARRHLDGAVAALADGRVVELGLGAGIAGIAWATEQLVLGGLVEVGSEDPSAEVDALLHEELSQPRWGGHHGHLLGLAGIGVYFLSRLPRVEARDALGHVVRHLDALAIRAAAGRVWYERPESGFAPRGFEGGIFDAGMAHGAAGVVSFLARASALDPPIPGARALLDDAVAWLLGPARIDDRIASWLGRDGRPFFTTPSWCRGELGIASALAAAGRAGHEAATAEARAITARLAALPVEADSNDGGLCHGAAGRALLLEWLGAVTGVAAATEAGRKWRDLGIGLGFPNSLGLLSGKGGIAALLVGGRRLACATAMGLARLHD